MAKRKKRIGKPDPRVWGYARVSTEDQDLRLQRKALNEYGVDGIFEEKASGADMDRKMLNWMMHKIYLRRGDTVVVWKLDRLGRSVSGLIEIVQEIHDRGANFVCLQEQIDTSTATGKFFFHVIAAMAEWERNMISERTKAGMAAARAQGATFGRKHLIKDDEKRLKHMRKLNAEGKLLDDKGVCMLTDKALWDELNAGHPGSPIGSLETVRRWRREGFPGLEIDE